MKKNHQYEVNHLNKTVVVTKKFLEEASQLSSEEAGLMARFEQMGLKVIVYKPKKTNKKCDKQKPQMLTYKMMKNYLSFLDDAEEMLEDFRTMSEGYKTNPKRLKLMNEWFYSQCPNYGCVEALDENHRITHDPNPVRKMESLSA